MTEIDFPEESIKKDKSLKHIDFNSTGVGFNSEEASMEPES
jgi:hypothetical protein